MRLRFLPHGFSFIELLVATAVFMAAAGLLFHFAARSQRLGAAEPESADLHQRLRVAAGMMQKDLINAGAGPIHGAAAGTLTNYLPPLVPARTGARSADPELTVFDDRISIVFVPDDSWHATLAADMAGPDAPILLDTSRGCPASGLCGFVPGTRAAIVDVSAVGRGYELFSVTDVSAGLAHGSPNPSFSRGYAAASSLVVPVIQHVYYRDAPSNRLMLYDGSQSDLPLVDNVVLLRFSYFADPAPAVVAAPAPGSGTCVYSAGDPPVPLLQQMSSSTLVELARDQLVDGPYCGIAPDRFDADLLRVRRVRVTIRAQAADPLRGKGEHFMNAGSSTAADPIKDFEVTFDVTPRNMAARR